MATTENCIIKVTCGCKSVSVAATEREIGVIVAGSFTFTQHEIEHHIFKAFLKWLQLCHISTLR